MLSLAAHILFLTEKLKSLYVSSKVSTPTRLLSLVFTEVRNFSNITEENLGGLSSGKNCWVQRSAVFFCFLFLRLWFRKPKYIKRCKKITSFNFLIYINQKLWRQVFNFRNFKIHIHKSEHLHCLNTDSYRQRSVFNAYSRI